MNKNNKKVMVFGTFDIFHAGHKYFLSQAKKYGDFLLVVVARNVTVEKVKNRRPLNNEQKRKKHIKESGLADKIIPGNIGDKYSVIKKYKPDVICLGYDQSFFVKGLKSELKKIGLEKTRIIKIKPYKAKIYKSSILRSKKRF